MTPIFDGAEWELSDRTIFVRRAAAPGQPPALFIHGLGGSSTNWTDLMAALSLDSVAPDASGFGYSPPAPDGDYRPQATARTMADLIRSWDVGPVHVFGNSLGGAIALQLAARWPDRVRSLTLISPALPQFSAMRTNIHLPVLSVPGVGERMFERFQQVDPASRAQGTIDLIYANTERVHPQRLAEAAAEVARRDQLPYVREAFLQSLRGLLATYRDSSENRPWRLAERVQCPVLVIHGREDKLVHPKGADRATRHFKDVRVVVLPDCGHVAMMEHPHRVARQWTSFAVDSGLLPR